MHEAVMRLVSAVVAIRFLSLWTLPGMMKLFLFETISPRPSYVDGSEMTVSPPPGLDEEVDDFSWDGIPFGLGRCECGLRIPHWDRCCWLCVG